MKNLFALAGFTLLSMSISSGIFAQEEDASETLYQETLDEQSPYFLQFSEGAACSWLTRIIKQSGRSNFVFEDFLPGIYSRIDLHTEKNITPMLRVAVLYPFSSTFNNYPQEPKTPLHIGADMNLGANFNILEFDYFRLNAGSALHMFFLNSDRWNYFNMGVSVFSGMELPLKKNWTIIFNGFASLDNGNLGGNRDMEPFDIAYQYQIDLGVRYSTKLTNKTSLFPGRQPAPDTSVFSR